MTQFNDGAAQRTLQHVLTALDPAESLRCVRAIVNDRATWYDMDRVHFADSVTGLTVGDLRQALNSIPDQIKRAVEAECEAQRTPAPIAGKADEMSEATPPGVVAYEQLLAAAHVTRADEMPEDWPLMPDLNSDLAEMRRMYPRVPDSLLKWVIHLAGALDRAQRERDEAVSHLRAQQIGERDDSRPTAEQVEALVDELIDAAMYYGAAAYDETYRTSKAEVTAKREAMQEARMDILSALSVAQEDSKRLDYLADWFSDGVDVRISHDIPDGCEHVRTWYMPGVERVGVLNVEDYEAGAHEKESLRDAIDAATTHSPTPTQGGTNDAISATTIKESDNA